MSNFYLDFSETSKKIVSYSDGRMRENDYTSLKGGESCGGLNENSHMDHVFDHLTFSWGSFVEICGGLGVWPC